MARKRARSPNRQVTRRPLRSGPIGTGPIGTGPTGSEPIEILLAGVTDAVIGLMARARAPLAAEQVICDLIALVELGIPAGPSVEARIVLRDKLIRHLIAVAERQSTAGALTLLRTCAVLGAVGTRASALAAAQRLTAAGVRDRGWVIDLGRPRAIRAWWYRDGLGRQESVGVLFEYGMREHALSVLIDHQTGGGIQDCGLSEGRDARELRHHTEAALVRLPAHDFADIDLVEAAELLTAAVAASPCPERPEQIESVATYLELVRSRAESLTAAARAGVRHRSAPR